MIALLALASGRIRSDIVTAIRSIFILVGVAIVYYSSQQPDPLSGQTFLFAAIVLAAVAVVSTNNFVRLEGFDNLLVSTVILQFVPVFLSLLLPMTYLDLRCVEWNPSAHNGRIAYYIPISDCEKLWSPVGQYDRRIGNVHHGGLSCMIPFCKCLFW